ncbi:hypothetical protein [Bacillus sp. OK048]|uniref:hypothetical protein n=1 Tax=Bacillus sp. OK048 TaxID=1882761 RepID=UPI00088AABC3|nr:hypothetical protein [Bacillus sp. OK048]SDN03158.1 hypothetical protein SAMN05443253_107218 [Bacillus sp. OK048]
MSKKTLVTAGMTALLSLGLLAGCGDGGDQDNGISDGEKKDAIDNGTVKEESTFKDAKENLKDAENNISNELKENGVGDGVDQDNGISDGEKKEKLDSSK